MASRDSQYTSSLFDHEINMLLHAQLAKTFTFFGFVFVSLSLLFFLFFMLIVFIGPNFVSKWNPEIHLLLNGSVFYFSIFKAGKTYGQVLQNVRYVPLKRWQKLLMGLGFVVFPYAHSRFSEIAVSHRWSEEEPNHWKHRLWRCTQLLEKIWKTVTLVNFFAFLWSGAYPNMLERLLGARIESASKTKGRSVAFDYMNRELVWEGFTEFLLFVTPLISFEKIQNFFRRKIAAANPTLSGKKVFRLRKILLFKRKKQQQKMTSAVFARKNLLIFHMLQRIVDMLCVIFVSRQNWRKMKFTLVQSAEMM